MKNIITNTTEKEGYALKLDNGYYCGSTTYEDYTENKGFTTRADCVKVSKYIPEPKSWIHPSTNGCARTEDILMAKTVWVKKTVITIIEEIPL